MAEPWTFVGESTGLGSASGEITAIEGSTFCRSDRGGNIGADRPEGLFFLDTRLLSDWELRVNGITPEPLAVAGTEPHALTMVSRVRPHLDGSGALLVVRRRYVGQGMREDVEIRNFATAGVPALVELRFDVDFADLFEVKEGRVDETRERSRRSRATKARFTHVRGDLERTVMVTFSVEPMWERRSALWHVSIPGGDAWRCCFQVDVTIGERPIVPRFRCGDPVEAALPDRRLERWRRAVPKVSSDHRALDLAVATSVDDLGSLRIFDPEYPERPVIAAGAPWFMTLFGRDSILASWMSLIVDPSMARGVVETLARLQGEEVNVDTEEEPGRILHEVRFGDAMSMALGDGHIYYGTADATPLFVMLVGELRRWGLETAVVDELLPNVDRALEWIERWGDRDGDGYVEYERTSERGLRNQGWKDSWDGVPAADGSLPETPIALCEVQGYTYAAYIARAHFAHEAGDTVTEQRFRDKADALKKAFNRDFWLDDRGWLAIGLDREKRPIDALTSNIGHCLWTGILDEDHAARVAGHLTSTAMFSGWGVRTLASSMSSYDPMSYHCGSIWPHDNALIAAGLMRYGYVDEAHRIILAMLDACTAHGGRLPELFAGIARDDVPTPVSYPTSCVPQAWAAAAPLLFVRTMLRFDPWIPYGKLWCDPALPPAIRRLTVTDIPLAGHTVRLHVEDDHLEIEGIDASLQLIREPRRPLTATSPTE